MTTTPATPTPPTNWPPEIGDVWETPRGGRYFVTYAEATGDIELVGMAGTRYTPEWVLSQCPGIALTLPSGHRQAATK